MNEPIMIAFIVFFAGALISFATAALIKGIFLSLRLRVKMSVSEQQKWSNATAATKS